MKRDAIFINTSRGGLVDMNALFAALKVDSRFARSMYYFCLIVMCLRGLHFISKRVL